MIKNHLKEIRMKEYMMSQTEFAEMLEVDMKVYNNWEREKNTPTLEKAMLVANKLNRDIKEIWYFD